MIGPKREKKPSCHPCITEVEIFINGFSLLSSGLSLTTQYCQILWCNNISSICPSQFYASLRSNQKCKVVRSYALYCSYLESYISPEACQTLFSNWLKETILLCKSMRTGFCREFCLGKMIPKSLTTFAAWLRLLS